MTLNVAILGWAHGHMGFYAKELGRIPGVRVTASWDHDLDRGKRSAEPFGCAMSTDLDEVLKDEKIPAVIVGVETSMHAEVCVAAAEAGKAILLQKPMALTLEDCDRIIEAVVRAGVPFSIAWQMRVDPQNLKIKGILDSGVLGKITMFRRKHCLATHLWPDFDKSWHVRRELNRGMWMDDAAHPFDLIHWLFGMPKSVMAEIDTLLNPSIPDDSGVAVFRTADGAIVDLFCSFAANAGENTTEVHGKNGTLIQNYGDGVSAASPRAESAPGLRWILNGETEWTDSGIPSPRSQQTRIEAVAGPAVEFFLGKRPPLGTAQEGRDVTEMLLASYESAATGKRVEFSRSRDREAVLLQQGRTQSTSF